jgi:Metallopeptidase toxin 2
MAMPGRKYSAANGYKYGFNGQENDKELNESIITALYWEYDSRLGKRWNVDPVIKPWQSPYSCFSNSPIVRVDPNGDDDYFDAKGNYLGSDKVGAAVRIISNPTSEIKNLFTKDGSTINKAVAQKNSQVLSNLIKGDDSKDLMRKVTLLNGIVNHYAKDAGIKGVVTPSMTDNEDSPAFTQGESNTHYNILFKGDRKIVDNYNNIINILYHEKLHQDDDRNEKKLNYYSDHAQIYINQINHSSFKGMSQDAQSGTIRSAMNYILNEAFSTATDPAGNDYGNNQQEANSLIEKLNIAIKSTGYQVTVGGIGSLNLYKDKKLISTVEMKELKNPN